mgnify:CR=1 FL=1
MTVRRSTRLGQVAHRTHIPLNRPSCANRNGKNFFVLNQVGFFCGCITATATTTMIITIFTGSPRSAPTHEEEVVGGRGEENIHKTHLSKRS